jgi:hypothetical protein
MKIFIMGKIKYALHAFYLPAAKSLPVERNLPAKRWRTNRAAHAFPASQELEPTWPAAPAPSDAAS